MEKHADIYFMPKIENPTAEQIGYFILKAAFLEEVAERGGITAEEATLERSLTLGRIGMGN